MKKKWTFQQKRLQNTCLFKKLRYQDLQKNVDFEAIENLFINMRNHLKRKIKNSRDIQEQC